MSETAERKGEAGAIDPREFAKEHNCTSASLTWYSHAGGFYSACAHAPGLGSFGCRDENGKTPAEAVTNLLKKIREDRARPQADHADFLRTQIKKLTNDLAALTGESQQ